MTWFGNAVTLADSPQLDAFNRLRVSTPIDLFSSVHQYNTGPLFWESVLNGGAVTHLPNESGIQLSTGGAAAGNYAIHQTKIYHRYQPGKSHFVTKTFNFGSAGDVNVARRDGYFDDSNGIFLEQSGTAINWVKRSFVTGAVVDTAIAQAAWNVDKFDGTGPSGVTLDFTKSQFLWIDMEWQGVGSVRCGFILGGVMYVAHEFDGQNVNASVYMTTANLPLRTEIRNIGAATGAATMKSFCQSVVSEGGQLSVPGIPFSASNGIGTIGVTTRRPVLSIRMASTLNGVTFRGHVEPQILEITASTNSAYWELIYNGTLTGAAFSAVDATNSGTEFDVAATAITGGTRIASGYVSAGGGASRGAVNTDLAQKIILAKTYAGVSDIFSVVCTSFSGTSNVSASINWREQY